MNEDQYNEQHQDKEMLHMWLEKVNRPGRLAQRNGEEITKEQLLEMIEQDRNNAMTEIEKMDSYEFQTRVLDGTLPEFIRETVKGIQRDTNHRREILTKKQFEIGLTNYGNVHRNKLRYISAEIFKKDCYEETDK